MLLFPLFMGALMGTISYFIERDVQSNQEAPIGLIAPADVQQTFKTQPTVLPSIFTRLTGTERALKVKVRFSQDNWAIL